ncbi:adenosylhomocysteinase [uncultured Actinomyces sp.]|uniref:adenosylhomocysteinase n=1 Tax=uncultured Actinomyces sp. TaxID=249061 RepID=UPI0028D130FA|nr:adenosylhomocysteinase [uncultured Actinomyces sp.]
MTHAQVLLRAYARATNMLIAGRRFVTSDPELASLLEAFGAQVTTPDSSEEAPSTPTGLDVIFDLDKGAFPHPGAITVLAPGGSFQGVYAPDASPISGPGDAGRIAWARSLMPVTEAAVRRIAHLLPGRRIGLALVLEPKTAALALMLSEAGAQVSVFGHASETRDDVADELRRKGLKVFADSQASPEMEEKLAQEFLAENIEYLLDDGSHLIRMAHDPHRAPTALSALRGAAEETTSGLRPLRNFPLSVPVIASNDARSKTLFDNAYGTGQSCWTTVLDIIDPDGLGAPIPGMRVGIIGYGDVGKGCARFARALGARVSVVELDPVRALQARMDGFTVAALGEVASTAGLLMSATGEPSTIPLSTLEALPKDAIVTVAGGVVGEVEVEQALAAGWTLSEAGPAHIQHLSDPNGKSLRLLEKGEGINYTAGEGNPIEIMDMSFGVQVAALTELLLHGDELDPGLHNLPVHADNAVAQAALDALRGAGNAQ